MLNDERASVRTQEARATLAQYFGTEDKAGNLLRSWRNAMRCSGTSSAHAAIKRRERDVLVTVMTDKFFGVHPEVIRSGRWADVKPGKKDLYIYLMEESERCCTREMRRTDSQITDAIGATGRTLCNARKKLQEFGLLRCRKGEGNKYIYTICNP